MTDKAKKLGYIFEVSWEVCNKVGGIHTVISTKTLSLLKNCEQLIMIGPDIWHDSKEDQEFKEDTTLFVNWKKAAEAEGLRVRIGRWKSLGEPITILVDFSNYIDNKDKILYEFWEDYKLDSLSGQWDYIEPALFGYAAGKAIESFVRFNLSVYDVVIAQFHEWMTGTGILYLARQTPQIATVFTTHATVVGRCIAGNGYPLYKNLDATHGDIAANDFNVISKHSLEKLSAQHADAFSTVSEITAIECKQLLNKEVDHITLNGFENNFVPSPEEYVVKRKVAREKFICVAEILSGQKYKEEPLIIATSGRYEMHNKGYDLFIDSLGNLNKDPNLQKEILACILVPGNNYGIKKSLYNHLHNVDGDRNIEDNYLTHNLHDVEADPIINLLKENQLYNRPEDKVKVIFVSSYLNGNDGIFNLPYYDLLTGIDLTVFVSYYEPWGYTPLESIAFGIPTVTTDLAGFGKWIQTVLDENDKCVSVINRNDDNIVFVTNELTNTINHFLSLSDAERKKLSNSAAKISHKALWEYFINEYLTLYDTALEKVEKRRYQIVDQPQQVRASIEIFSAEAQSPVWRRFEIQTIMPQRLNGLVEMSMNLWWMWNYRASQLFKYIDPQLWRASSYNPVSFLEEVTWSRMKELEKDDCFIEAYDSVYSEFRAYMDEEKNKKTPKIAYFSMEFGLNDNLQIFSGGLGILAGDYLKEASDTNTDMVGVGLLYRQGYFRQKISIKGEQQAEYIDQDFGKMPLIPVWDEHGVQMKVSIHFPGRVVYLKIWKVEVGRISLFLLDADTDENQERDRAITFKLYGGDLECRFIQEMILGIGGVRALRDMGIRPDIYHCNEGHAAFIGLERLRRLRAKWNLKFEEALEIIRSSTLFTTHTPVAAGHDLFDENLIRKYMSHYPERLKISWEDMMKLGKLNPEDKFSMSYLASNVSQEINGVSKLHGKVSQELFAGLWKGYFPEENHIGYVTNGVHYNTWTAKEWKLLYEKEFGEGFLSDLSNPEYWNKIHEVDNAVIWSIRQKQRYKLVDYVKMRLKKNWVKRYEDPKDMVETLENIDGDVLTIGFARRFATYKRGDLIFRNLDRLSAILNNKETPVQLLFAGKAHPNDAAGQELIKKIVSISKQSEFLGKIIFIEDYDISLAKKLVQGVDVWLNTPTRPQEASGTSGMKAVMNGALHFSVLDGWWVEGFRPNAGWALPEETVYENQEFQNELDAQMIYNILENDIVPLFYNRDENNIPNGWIEYIKNSIGEIAPQFTTKRMLDDYKRKYYHKLYDRSRQLRKDDYKLAIAISEWKKNMQKAWNDLEVISAKFPDYEKKPMNLQEDFTGEIEINLKQLNPEEIGVEVIISNQSKNNENVIAEKYIAECVSVKDNIAKFIVKGRPQKSGFYNYAIRIHAKNALLPYPHDSGLVLWV
ncbi:MAG: alpha-glucan family phosphorylase [Bacteroidales bacterium]|jgi:phosphorylase/glycogen(starch) synthase|nr:alpha-glucan family phosphorylase [Bacteroidales bacterium]